jgi:hypothetical protein
MGKIGDPQNSFETEICNEATAGTCIVHAFEPFRYVVSSMVAQARAPQQLAGVG